MLPPFKNSWCWGGAAIVKAIVTKQQMLPEMAFAYAHAYILLPRTPMEQAGKKAQGMQGFLLWTCGHIQAMWLLSRMACCACYSLNPIWLLRRLPKAAGCVRSAENKALSVKPRYNWVKSYLFIYLKPSYILDLVSKSFSAPPQFRPVFRAALEILCLLNSRFFHLKIFLCSPGIHKYQAR